MTARRSDRLPARLSMLLLVAAFAVGGCGDLSVVPTSTPGVPDPSSSAALPSATPSSAAASAFPGTTPPPTPAPTPTGPPPTIEQLIGQRMVVTLDGATPSAALLKRIRTGQVGGVILFGWQIESAAGLAATTALLHQAAADGGQPPLLVMTDQEGGSIRRLDWAPPELSAWEMGRQLDADGVRNVGLLTGKALADAGINMDLAPVADVAASTRAYMYFYDRRAFALQAGKVSDLSVAFALGLLDAGVLPTVKHFPGIGRAIQNTDQHVVSIGAPRSALAVDLLPYRAVVAAGLPLIMLSNAVYPALDAHNAAGWSPYIVGPLLRDELGFTGVTITDALDGAAAARGVTVKSLALKAATAGSDLLMIIGSDKITLASYSALIAAARNGTLSMDSLVASYNRILALKATMAK